MLLRLFKTPREPCHIPGGKNWGLGKPREEEKHPAVWSQRRSRGHASSFGLYERHATLMAGHRTRQNIHTGKSPLHPGSSDSQPEPSRPPTPPQLPRWRVCPTFLKTTGHYTRWLQTRIHPGFLSRNNQTKMRVQQKSCLLTWVFLWIPPSAMQAASASQREDPDVLFPKRGWGVLPQYLHQITYIRPGLNFFSYMERGKCTNLCARR